MDEKLIRSIKGAGKTTESITLPDGSQVLVSPYGGRILGLFAADDARNFYWVNPAMRTSASARKYFASEQWQNIGGERTWLGPEIDFFLPQFPDVSVYHQPRPLDAGTFTVEKKAGRVRLATEFSVTPSRRPAPVKLRLTKSVEPAPNPLRRERSLPLPKGVQFAGYTLRTTLEFVDAPAPAVAVGLWSLTQMPHGGEMLIPTYGRAKPLIFFGAVPRSAIRTRSTLVRYRMASASDHKIGLRAVSTTGRVGYFYGSKKTAQLVVKNFFGNPSGEYVDAPWTDPADLGYCVQACNISNPTFGDFSELEYHIPAIGGASGKTSSEDVAQVWAYRGTRAQLGPIAEKLLGVPSGTL